MKAALRKQIGRMLPSRAVSATIQERLITQEWWVAVFSAGLYRSLPQEPSTDALLSDLLARRARVAVPVRNGSGYRWGWVDATTEWQPGNHGILEPRRSPVANARELRVIVVPGMAFDIRGGRLGRGGGHYDRLLAQATGLRVGLCPERCLVAEVPLEPHDQKVDVVVTEKRIIYADSAAAKLEGLTG